jgi:HEPN domain-containing protein
LKKIDYIKYWAKSAADDAKTMQVLFLQRRYVHALFFAHLHLEKLCKALWVKHNNADHPPRIHNIIRLLEEAKIQLEESDLQFLDIVNEFQIEGRYPDYIDSLRKKCTFEITKHYIKQTKIIAKCLREKLH